jgi:hypothetical protein
MKPLMVKLNQHLTVMLTWVFLPHNFQALSSGFRFQQCKHIFSSHWLDALNGSFFMFIYASKFTVSMHYGLMRLEQQWLFNEEFSLYVGASWLHVFDVLKCHHRNENVIQHVTK